MALALHEIKWSDPILPARPDPAWEAEVKRRGGRVGEVDRRIAPSPWVREAGFSVLNYRPSAMPQRLYVICALVTAQENSCRYCYGANRAYMKILGYSESFISRLERDVQMAELEATGTRVHRLLPQPGAIPAATAPPGAGQADRHRLFGAGRQRDGVHGRDLLLLQPRGHLDRLPARSGLRAAGRRFRGAADGAGRPDHRGARSCPPARLAATAGRKLWTWRAVVSHRSLRRLRNCRPTGSCTPCCRAPSRPMCSRFPPRR